MRGLDGVDCHLNVRRGLARSGCTGRQADRAIIGYRRDDSRCRVIGARDGRPIDLRGPDINEADDSLGVGALLDLAVRTLDSSLFSEMSRYMHGVAERRPGQNFDAGRTARFARRRKACQNARRNRAEPGNGGTIIYLFAPTGVQDNTISHLLRISSSKHYLAMAPMVPECASHGVEPADEMGRRPARAPDRPNAAWVEHESASRNGCNGAPLAFITTAGRPRSTACLPQNSCSAAVATMSTGSGRLRKTKELLRMALWP